MNVQLTIIGEPASKANSRELVTFGKRAPLKETLQWIVANIHDQASECIERARRVLEICDDSRPALIKSKKARDYEAEAQRQIPDSARVMMTGPVRVTLRIFYASERPDLDESVVLDVLQAKFSKIVEGQPRRCERAGVYANDRQVREKHVFHGIDKANPRAEIDVEQLQPHAALFEDLPVPIAPRARRPHHVDRRDVPATPAGENPF